MRSIAALALALFLALLADAADAQDLIARNGKDWVRINDKACENKKVLQHVPPQMHEQFRSATVQFEGQLYLACWIGTAQGVVIVYEDSDRGGIPYSAFEPVRQL